MRLKLSRCHIVLVWLLFVIGTSQSAFAGLMGTAGLHWKVHSLKPLAEESTPNYYGVGPYGSLGYSLGKVWDMGLFASYSPSQLNHASLGAEDAQIVFYGLETAFRMGKAFYLGLRGGALNYHLIAQKKDNEIDGQWTGTGGSLVVGGLIEAGRNSYWQITLNVGAANIEPDQAGDVEERRVDWVGFAISYVYIGLDRFRIDNIFLKDWLNF